MNTFRKDSKTFYYTRPYILCRMFHFRPVHALNFTSSFLCGTWYRLDVHFILSLGGKSNTKFVRVMTPSIYLLIKSLRLHSKNKMSSDELSTTDRYGSILEV